MREFSFKEHGIEINFFIEEESKNKYDTTYFGHIQIHKYRTWGYFTKSQINYISKKFPLKDIKTSKALHNISSGNHLTKLKAKENKFYFNAIPFFIYYGKEFDNSIKRNLEYNSYEDSVKKYHENNIKNYIHEQIVMFKKLPLNLIKILTDRNQLVYKEDEGFKFSDIDRFYFGELSRFLEYYKLKNIDFNDYIPSYKDNSFKKEFINFIHKNRFYSKYNKYGNQLQFNLELFKVIILLNKIFKNYEFKSFKEYKKCLLKVFKDKGCFKNEIRHCLNNEELISFKNIFNSFIGDKKNPTTIFNQWSFYSSYHDDISNIVSKLKNKGVEFYKYKNPFEDFRFLSARYSFEEIGNFYLPNKDSVYFNTENIESTYNKEIQINDEVKLKLIEDYNTLIYCGAKLHNCAGSEETIDYYKKSVTLGLYINDDLKYLLSMKKFDLRQFKGFKNSSPPMDLFLKVVAHLKKEGFILPSYKINYKETCIQSYNGR